MLHPSYKEMIEKVNAGRTLEESEIKSRYTLVLAAAKRARQINSGSEPLVPMPGRKENTRNLSVAVAEMYAGQVHVLNDIDNYEDLPVMNDVFFPGDVPPEFVDTDEADGFTDEAESAEEEAFQGAADFIDAESGDEQ